MRVFVPIFMCRRHAAILQVVKRSNKFALLQKENVFKWGKLQVCKM